MFGGAETNDYNLALCYKKEGYNVTLACASKATKKYEKFIIKSIPVFDLYNLGLISKKYIGFIFRIIFEINFITSFIIINRKKYDYYFCSTKPYTAFILKKFVRGRVIFAIRGKIKKIFMQFTNRLDLCVFWGGCENDYSTSLREKINSVNLYPAVDKNLFKILEHIPNNLKLGNDENVKILFVGRLEPVKNLFSLIDVVSKVKKNNIELIIIGSGFLKRKLQKYASRIDSIKITFLGTIEKNIFHIITISVLYLYLTHYSKITLLLLKKH